MRSRNIVICVLPGSTEFFHIFSQTVQFSKKKKTLELNLCLIFSTTFFEAFLVLQICQPGTMVNKSLGEVIFIIFGFY